MDKIQSHGSSSAVDVIHPFSKTVFSVAAYQVHENSDMTQLHPDDGVFWFLERDLADNHKKECDDMFEELGMTGLVAVVVQEHAVPIEIKNRSMLN